MNGLQIFKNPEFGEAHTFTEQEGSVTVSHTTKVAGKGQQYFINKFLAKKLV